MTRFTKLVAHLLSIAAASAIRDAEGAATHILEERHRLEINRVAAYGFSSHPFELCQLRQGDGLAGDGQVARTLV